MAENVYEGMFILDTSRYGRDSQAASGQIAEMIQKAGGEMLVSRLWEERRLAYTIKGHRKGTYWLTYFRLSGEQLAGLERRSQLNDLILRVLFLKVDPRIVETLVEHAKAGHVRPARDEARKPAGEGGKPTPKEKAVAVAEKPRDGKPEVAKD